MAEPPARAFEDRQFRSDLNDELVDILDEDDPWFYEAQWWPWVEEKHTLGYHEQWMWQTGQYAEIADCLRWGEPLPESDEA